MLNGLVKDEQIISPSNSYYKEMVRMGQNKIFWYGSIIHVKFKRMMTITGIAFNGSTAVDGIILKYGASATLLKETNNGDVGRKISYTKPNEVQYVWFDNDTFTIDAIHLTFPNSQNWYTQIEFYGCPEICHSLLRIPTLPNNATKDLSFPQLLNNKTITLVHPLTISGVIITLLENQQLSPINILCKLKNNVAVKHQVNQRFTQEVIAFWVNEVECDEIIINGQYVDFKLVGCDSLCMRKLSVLKPDLSSIDYYGGEYPSRSKLNQIYRSWLSKNTQQPWIRACFRTAVVISGIAMQAQGWYGYGHIKKYTIQYSYGDSTTLYNYTLKNNSIIEFESGINSRYTTYVKMFPEPIQTMCIQVTGISCYLSNTGGCALRWDVLGCQQLNVDVSSKIENITITSKSVSFSWRQLTNSVNDFIVTNYGIIIKEKYRKTTILNLVTKATFYVAEGLTPYTKYVLYVNGFNRFNVSIKAEKEFITKSSILEPCKQPLGMQNGLVKDDQIISPDNWLYKESVRMGQNKSYWYGNIIHVKFRRMITITGIAFKGRTAVDGILLKYGASATLLKETNNGHGGRKVRYTKPNEVQYVWFDNDTFTIDAIHLTFPNSKDWYTQIEFYGCPEICHSLLHIPTLPDNVTKDISFPQLLNNKTITFVIPLTISGVIITLLENQQLARMDMLCKLKKNNIINHQVNQRFPQEVIAFWVNEVACDEIIINGQYADFKLVGCDSACMRKLSVLNPVLSSTEHYSGEGPSRSNLNHISGSWLSLKNTQQPWIRACFSTAVVISGIAMQAQGWHGYKHIKKYTIQYSYGDSCTLYNYTLKNSSIIEFESGINSRYTTYVKMFPEPIQAMCIQVTGTSCYYYGGCALRWDVLGCLEFIGNKILLNAITTTNSSASMSWSIQSSSVEFVITGYSIVLKEKQTNKIVRNVTTSNTTQYVMSNLTIYTQYIVEFFALNRFNVMTEPLEVDFTTKEGRPTIPLNIGVVERDGKLEISWDEPFRINGILKEYKILVIGKKFYFPIFEDRRTNATVSSTTSIFHNIYPGTNYTIHVRAVTGGGEGDTSTAIYETKYGRPRIGNVTALMFSLNQQQVILHQMPQLTGPITNYEFAVSADKTNTCFQSPIYENRNVKFSQLKLKKTIIISKGISYITFDNIIIHLNMIGSYLFCFRAVVNYTLIGEAGSIHIYRNDLVNPAVSTQHISTVALKLPRGPPSTSFYVIVVSLGALDTEPDPSELKGFKINNPSVPYITGIFEEYRESFTVGDGRNYSRLKTKQRRAVRNVSQYDSMVVMNVPLEEGKTYLISVRAHDESSFYSSPWITFKSRKDENKSENGLSTLHIIISVVAVVAIVAIIIGAIFLKRRRKSAQVIETFEIPEIKDKHELIVQDHDETIEEESKFRVVDPGVSEETNGDVLYNNLPQTRVIINVKYPPVELENLSEYWKQLNKNKKQRLKEEYKALKTGQMFDWLDGLKPESKSKNRYANILTYDHSRVKLKDLTTNQCDYINASFIHGYNKHDMYIATQGPSKTTMADFWQMVWEQNTSVIVMVTNIIEKNKVKCEQYWPESDQVTHGNIEVKLSMTETYADFVIRTFLIKKQNSDTERTIQQYHYLSWPDHGVPEYPTDLLRFCRKIRKDHSTETLDTPMVVHCSAGVGRTGTYICIDNMLKHAKDTNAVDVFNFVNHMRSRRIHMVQTEDQYRFIYHALYDDSSCGSTEITVSKFPQEVKALSSLDKSKKNGYQRQFEMLISTTLHHSEEDTNSALKDGNKSKNRSSILPRDRYRVVLDDSIYENYDDYINAVYVNGYKRKNAYIATEHPLETTVCECWKMILQNKITSILILNPLCGNNKEHQMIFPVPGESIDHKNINVKTTNEKQLEEINIKSLVINCDISQTHVKTTIFSYNAWTDKSVPDQPHGLIKLLTLVEKTQGQNPDSPVVVMCSDGSGRTGTFIAISILIEQLQMEQAIDVLQTVKKIRISRPEFVDNVKQYEFCYNAIQAYIDGFSTYSNFA